MRQYQDTGWNTKKTAPTLFEYDRFGNLSKQTLALADTPTKDNAPVLEMAYSVESAEDGVYSVTTQTCYNAAGQPLFSSQKQLFSPSIENKLISISERGLTSTQWVAYNTGTKRTTYSNIPTSTITVETVTVDGFVVSRKDNAGITSTAARAYATRGMILKCTGAGIL